MSRFFKYIDQCPNVTESLMEGDSNNGLEFEALFIANNSNEDNQCSHRDNHCLVLRR